MKQFLTLLLVVVSLVASVPDVSAAETRCPPVPLSNIKALLDKAQTQLQLVDYSLALSTLEKTELEFPCVSETLPAETLSTYFVQRGLTMFYLNNEDLAKVSFMRALAVNRDLRWNSRWGMKARETFLDAKEAVIGMQTESVRCPILAPGVTGFVNGHELTQGDSINLWPGQHLLQLRWADGHWEGVMFEVSPGREVPLPLPKQALQPQADSRIATNTDGGQNTQATKKSEGAETDTARTLFYTTAALTGLGLAGTTVFGIQYVQTRNELWSGDYYNDVQDEAKDQLLEKHSRVSVLTNISMGFTAVAAAATTYFFVKKSKKNQTARIWTPWFDGKAGGLALHSTF